MANFDLSRDSSGILAMTKSFFRLEAAGGILLVIAATLALIIANSPLLEIYHYFLNDVKFTIGFGTSSEHLFGLSKPLLLWINDGLMAIFFFLVGLEIKREIMRGELSTREQALLPALAAIGGMAVPALIYYFINHPNPETVRGWAIPSATDIAFSLGVLALLGSRVPVSLKILLTAIAVIDDLGAILIIAFFYSDQVLMTPLLIAGAAIAGLVLLNLRGVSRIAAFVLLGTVLWFAFLKAGIHPTLAGVITALCIPLTCSRHPDRNPVETLEHYLHPWVAFMVLPIFAFANAGVPFSGISWASFSEPVTFGIICGLFFGKLIGIFGILFLAIKTGLCRMPKDASWLHLWGLAHLCGIGFTMSLFIGELAFAGHSEFQAPLRLGVLSGSLLSAAAAYAILYYAGRKRA